MAGKADPYAAGVSSPDFEIVEEKQVHRRYLTLYDRRIKFQARQGREEVVHDYDIVGHPQCEFHFGVAFPFHKVEGSEGEVTLLREHCQGPNEMMFVLPTGGFDPRKHTDWLQCAKSELSEEALLQGGSWHSLLPEGHPGIAEVKWCANRFSPYLCINPQEDTAPGKRDLEELIEVHRVPLRRLRAIMTSGEMLLPSVSTCYMALEKLRELGLTSSQG